jgi:hypothetical protein
MAPIRQYIAFITIGAETGGEGGIDPHFYSNIVSFAVSGWTITREQKKFLARFAHRNYPPT